MSVHWTVECRRPSAMDALSTVVCMCIRVAALSSKTFTGTFFPLFYTGEVSSQRCDLSFSIFLTLCYSFWFLSATLLWTWEAELLSLALFLLTTTFLGASVPQSWQTSLVDVEYFGCTHKMEEG